MNTTLACYLALLSVAPAASPDAIFADAHDGNAPVIRAQSFYDPLYDSSGGYEGFDPYTTPAPEPAFAAGDFTPAVPLIASNNTYGGYPHSGSNSSGYGGSYTMPPITAPTSYYQNPAPSPAPITTPQYPMVQPQYSSPGMYPTSPPVYDQIWGQNGLFDPSIVGDGYGFSTYGTHGPQPYRYGLMSRWEMGFLPKVQTSDGLGQFGVLEVDADIQYTAPAYPTPKIFTYTQEFSYRGWDGPTGAPGLTTALPGDVYRFGFNMALATPQMGPWTIKAVFDPSINTDFEDNLTSKAWNIDGHAMAFFRPDAYITYVLGAGYWDRVNDKVIPYAGIIWTPDDRWEWRLVFPDMRVSYFCGNELGLGCWLYVRAEYHIEAYEIQLPTTGAREQVEVEDWRALMGIRKDNGWFGMFLEAGWVFGRNVAFLNGTPGFDPTTGFITRAGVHF